MASAARVESSARAACISCDRLFARRPSPICARRARSILATFHHFQTVLRFHIDYIVVLTYMCNIKIHIEAPQMSKEAGAPTPEVAVVGGGPVGLMIANLLGLAGVSVLVLERNRGLLGLPRAIAYDAETLRLF